MKAFGWYISIIIALSPLIIWVTLLPVNIRFISQAAALRSLGEITGLVGMALFSVDLVLGARLKFLERYFGGLNRMYLAHHIYGGVALVLLLIHPLLLAGMYALDSLKSAALFLLPGQDWTINFGISSLYLMMGLLILTFFTNIPYHIWKLSHKLLGPTFFIGAIHGFFATSSDLVTYPLMRNYMLVIVIIGSVAYIYRSILASLFVKKIFYTVTAVKKLSNDVIEVDLQSINRPISFLPGQFVFIGFHDRSVSGEMHPFSISSAPTDDSLAITIKSEGDYTQKLLNIAPGSKAFVEGAFGGFSYEECPNPHQIWIGGGIGITPFLSMAKTLKDHPHIFVDLYYTMHDESESVYVNELENLAKETSNLQFAPLYSTKHGRLTAEIIAKASSDIEKKDFFICGPPPMMHSLKNQLRKLGVPKDQIHSEEFSWE